MNPRPRLCVVGSTNVDLFFRAPRLPQPGETLACDSFELGHGGKGANQAVMAARLGSHVSLIGKIGADVFGQGALQSLRAQGVDVTHVKMVETTSTGLAGIVVDRQADNCILVVAGANGQLTPADVRQAAETIHAADAVLCQLEVPLETVLEAFRTAKQAGRRTILNPAPAQDLPSELLQLTDVLVPNETELGYLSGSKGTNLADLQAAAESVRIKGPRTVLVTLAERGTLIVDGCAVKLVPAFPVKAVDPSGAGDAFVGSLGVLLAKNWAMEEAVKHANAVAALSVTRLGTQASYPSGEDVESWFEKWGLTSVAEFRRAPQS